MGVVYVEELFDGRSGSGDFKRQRTYTRKFEVRTSSPADGPRTVASSPLLPGLGQPYIVTSGEGDFGALVKSVEPEQHADDPTLWVVTVKYDSKLDFSGGRQQQQQPKDQPEDPLSRPAVWKFGFQRSTQPARFDKDGVPVLNSAGCPFDPPFEYAVVFPTITITLNKAAWWLDDVMRLVDSVNAKKWFNFPPRTVKIETAEAATKFENGLGFWEVTWNLIVNPETWDVRLLDCGFMEKVDATPSNPMGLRLITDAAGKVPVVAVPLKNGKVLPRGQPPETIPFRMYDENDFNNVVP